MMLIKAYSEYILLKPEQTNNLTLTYKNDVNFYSCSTLEEYEIAKKSNTSCEFLKIHRSNCVRDFHIRMILSFLCHYN